MQTATRDTKGSRWPRRKKSVRFREEHIDDSSPQSRPVVDNGASKQIFPFFRNRKRSTGSNDPSQFMQAVESSTPLVEEPPKNPPSIVQFFRHRTQSRTSVHGTPAQSTIAGASPASLLNSSSRTLGSDTQVPHPSTSGIYPKPDLNRSLPPGKSSKPLRKHAPHALDPDREVTGVQQQLRTVKRRRSTRLFSSKPMVVEQSPSMPATVSVPSPSLNVHAKEFVPRGSIRSSEAPVKSTSTSIPMDTHILLSTMLPDKMEEGAKPSVLDSEPRQQIIQQKDPPSSGITAGSSTCVTEQKPERNATTSGNAGLAVTQKIPPYLPPRQLAEVVVDRAAGQSTIVDMVSPLAPRLDPKSPYIPPHRRRQSTGGATQKSSPGGGLPSTIPFPVHSSVPDIRPVINGTSSTAPNEELYVSPKSEYRIYKNLLRVLWTEANLKGDLQMREKINRCSTLNTSSSTISVLVSGLDSQRYLLSIASKLSLDHDKIRNALCEDRKCIRARLISSQKDVLEREGHAHRILDLAQDISDNLDSLSNVDASSSLPRLIFKLCVACDRLPSSLSITGVEKIERHPIARGAFGDVYQAVYRSEPVALKRMRFFQGNTEEERQATRLRFFREAVVWKSLNHPSILPFLGLDSDDGGSPSLAMVSPWMKNGTIVQYIKKDQTADLDALLLQIVQGLNYLHFRIIVHGDLRGDNILVDDEGHARLADFGLTFFADATIKSSTPAGTTRWMAPELLLPSCAGLDRFERTFSSDVYSFACVCFELYTGAQPFEEIKIDISVSMKVTAGERPGRSPEIPARIWQLIRSCWCQEPSKRLKTPVIIANFEMMEKERTQPGLANAAQGEARQSRRSLGMSRTAGSTPSLSPSVRNPPSLIVNISAPANNETDNWRRRNSFWKPPRFFHEFSPAASSDHSKPSWRDRTRAISMLFNKTKSEETPVRAVQTQDVRTSSVHAKPQEHQRGRFLSLLPRSKPKISLAPENSEH